MVEHSKIQNAQKKSGHENKMTKNKNRRIPKNSKIVVQYSKIDNPTNLDNFDDVVVEE